MSDRRIGNTIVIVGMMGSGKSTVGALVAEHLGIPFLDNDILIEQRDGRSPAEQLRSDAQAFRALEADLIDEVLNADAAGVFSVGGGAPVTPTTRARLGAHAPVVWLRASEDVLFRRLEHEAAHRPMLDGDARERLHALLAERTDVYEEVSSVVIAADGAPQDVARAVVAAVAEVLA